MWPLFEAPALLPWLPSSLWVGSGAVDRSCGLGLSGCGCWGRSRQGSGTHGHTGELPDHSRPQRPLQAEGGWVGLWSRASAGHFPGWGGRGGCGVYGGLSECSPHRAGLLSPPLAGRCPRGLVLYLPGLLAPGPGGTSPQPPPAPVCVRVSFAAPAPRAAQRLLHLRCSTHLHGEDPFPQVLGIRTPTRL